MAVLLVLVAITISVLLLVNKHLVASGFREVEVKAGNRYVRLVRAQINERVESLVTKAKDWANWTDLWTYSKDRNKAFADSNLQTNVLRSLSINYMFIIDRNGKVLFGQKFDIKGDRKVDFQKSEVDELRKSIAGMNGRVARRVVGGITQVDGRPIIVTVQELHRTDGSGEPRGSIMMGRIIDKDTVRRIADPMQVDISLGAPNWDTSGEALGVADAFGSKLSSQYLTLAIPIDAIGGQSIPVFVRVGREAHQQELALLRLLYIGIIIAAVILTVGMWYLLTRVVLARVNRLRSELSSLRLWKAGVERVTEGYKDELGCLAGDINALIAVKDAYAADLSNAHGDLIAYMAAIPFSLMLFDNDGHLVDANERALQLFSTRPSAESEAMLWNLPLGKSREALEDILARTTKRLAPETLPTVVIDTPEGSRIFDVVINAISMSGGTTKFLMSAIDVSDKHMLQRQLANAQKLESIGQLAAGIAHEINTPTQFVTDNVRFLGEGIDALIRLFQNIKTEAQRNNTDNSNAGLCDYISNLESTEDSDYLVEQMPIAVAQSIDGLTRISTIVRAMKEFSHPATEAMSPADINRAVESTVSVSRNEWKYVAELELDLDENLPLVECSINEINQVLLNLIVNASHAIADVVKDSGSLGRISIKTSLADDESILITVSDSGNGIPPEIRNKIFDPFFTTKDVGKGTGQGLSIAHNVVVNHHQGQLEFVTSIGQGTSFIIRLPITQSVRESGEAA